MIEKDEGTDAAEKTMIRRVGTEKRREEVTTCANDNHSRMIMRGHIDEKGKAMWLRHVQKREPSHR